MEPGQKNTTTADSTVKLESIIEPVSAQLAQVRKRVLDAVPKASKLAKLSPAAGHILGKHGKYLRPAIVLLSCGLCGERPETAVDYAAVMELVHVGSLVFDDLLDGSELRRGRKTINALWGDKTALLAGTHLLLEIANRTAFEGEPVRQVVIRTLNSMFQGETLQFSSHGKFELDEETYMEIITEKSASALSACSRLGALAAGDTARAGILESFGMEMGIAFQIRDDVLDLVADPVKLGKEPGSDLREARMTLPVIHCARNAARGDKRFLKSVFGLNSGEKIDIGRVVEIARDTGSISFCMQRAHELVDRAIPRLDAFEDSPYKRALTSLCRFAVERDY